MLDDVEAGASTALSKDDGSFCNFSPKHVFLDVVDLFFGQIVKNEMVFERCQDKLLIDFIFSLSQRLNSFVSDPQSHLIESDELILLCQLLDH